MSVVIETLVFCDGCQENMGGDDRHMKVSEIRYWRKQQGWIQRGSKDYCDECAVTMATSAAARGKASDDA